MSKSTYGLRKAGLATLATTLVMGAGIAGAGSASALPGFSFDRVGGADRYETSADIADDFAATNPDVILANGSPGNYADALSANTLAGEKNVPILLTRADKTPQPVLDQLAEDAVKNITVVGGETVITPAQVASLESKGYTVTRVAGSDRFATNAQVISKSGNAAGNTGLIATGFNFPDALAAGPFSFVGHPLGLSSENNIEQSVIDALKAAGVTKVLIFGGTSAVGTAVETKLAANGITTAQRFAGADRSDTSELAAEYAVKNLGFTDKHLGVASGYTLGYGADALAGGPLEGKEKSPMLITRDVNNPDDVLTYLTAHCGTLADGHIYGGPAAVSVAAEAAMEKAADCVPASATSRPELRSAAITGTVRADQATPSNPAGTTVVYTFDEDVATVTTGATGLFHAYKSDRTEVIGGTVVSTSGKTVTVRFNDADTATEAAAISVATVDAGAVTDLQGQGGTEGDAPLGATSGGGSTTLPAGITDAPDLLSVGNFRQAASVGHTAVDFTFDQPATVLGTSGYSLILDDGADGASNDNDLDGVGPATGSTNAGGGTIAGGNGTTTITVIFENPDGIDDNATPGQATDPMITAGDVARGTVDDSTVESGAATETADAGVNNVLQSADVSNGGNTLEPDLVSVSLQPGAAGAADKAVFTFDQPLTAADATLFELYDFNGVSYGGVDGSDVINVSNKTQVVVTFAPNAADGAVGGNVVDGAVTTAGDATATPVVPAGDNEQDEAGVGNTASSGGQTAGRTAGPDLTGVALVRGASDPFGNPGNFSAVYTFDEDVTVTSQLKFKLYAANGATYVSTVCAVTTPGSGQTAEDVDNTVTCTTFGTATSAQIGAATLGTVDDGAVTEQSGGSLTNVEGAENTTGGTGTPSA